ncbi:MAG TPA: tripartite tricarboxylate transporter substrate binding protein [Xanthobacteraceae bacterium]|nr:tripartite tricarboxylate transporter substrate binding protein [Xanthobacteraceae bacterium]
MKSVAIGIAAAAVAAVFVQAEPATAQSWPSKPIHLMVGFGAGGGTDVATRIVAEPLGDVLGQRFVVENKPGAGGTIAGDIVAKGAKDGYNALMISTGHTVSAVMIKSQAYDAVKDFAPVGIVANSAIAIVVAKDFPANDLKGLIDLIKSNPGKYNYGTVGVGSTQHLTAELFRQRAGLQIQAVSFRTTGEVVTALLRKDVAYAFDIAHAVRGQVASGQLKLIAVSTGKRFPSIPNVPTMIESGMPGFEVNGWYGLVYPAGVPAAIIAKTHAALSEVLSRDTVKKQLANIGAEASLSTPEQFKTLIADEIARWRDVAKTAGLQPQ